MSGFSRSLTDITTVAIKRDAHIGGDLPDELTPTRLIKAGLRGMRDMVVISSLGARLFQLAYIHFYMLADRFELVQSGQTKRLIRGAFSTIQLLTSEQNLASPFLHHFTAHATITLAEVLHLAPKQVGRALAVLKNGLDNATILYPYGDDARQSPWSAVISRFIENRMQLVDAENVDGAGELTDEDAKAAIKELENQIVDWTHMGQAGYLRLLE